jgi:serine/threonine-protein kinase
MDSLNSPELAAGTRVGSYRIVKVIGRGGFGVVYQAVHGMLPRVVALKVMHAELRGQPGMATRMVLEATALDGIRHFGVTRIFESSVLPDGRVWLAMELVEGESLAARFASAHRLPAHTVAELIANVAEVLEAAHARNIIHRDLKPDNIILTEDDRDFPLRVIDWGIARHMLSARITLEGMVPGTPTYMSPEQTRGDDFVGPQSDVYALGVTAYEALSGHAPFEGSSLAEIVCAHLTLDPPLLAPRCDAPADLCALVHAMLAKNPAERPTTLAVQTVAREIARRARQALDRRPTMQMEVVTAPAANDGTPVIELGPLEMKTAKLSRRAELATGAMRPIAKPRWTPELVIAQPPPSATHEVVSNSLTKKARTV